MKVKNLTNIIEEVKSSLNKIPFKTKFLNI